MSEKIIGIMGAMQEEIQEIISTMQNIEEHRIGNRIYYAGMLHHSKVVVVFSRWGKVAAASTATTLIQHFNINQLIFTGVAGAIDSSLKIGDVVVGSTFYQHDMDARPFFNEFEIPLLNVIGIKLEQKLVDAIAEQLRQYFHPEYLKKIIPNKIQEHFYLKHPSIYTGTIASGDRFFDSEQNKNELSKKIPGVLCVEMEGAAVAQVCHEHHLPFYIIRTISDSANESAAVDFSSFIQHIAGPFSRIIAESLVRYLS